MKIVRIVYRLVIWVVILLVPTQLFSQENLEFFRSKFQVAEGESDFQLMLDTKVLDTIPGNENIIKGYKAVCTSALAQYIFNPYTKYQLFNEGKAQLEESIATEKGVEIVFLRVVIQLSIPKFLGYADDIENDLAYLKQEFPKPNVPIETKKFIIKTIQDTGNKDYDLNSLSLWPLNLVNAI